MIDLYMNLDCPWSIKLRRKLKLYGPEFKSIPIRHNNDAIKFLQEHNLYTIPQVFDGDKHIGGYEETIEYIKQKRN